MTHDVTYLSQMDLIVMLENGQISDIGKYSELVDSGGLFAKFLKSYLRNPGENSYSSDGIYFTHKIIIFIIYQSKIHPNYLLTILLIS